MALVFSGDILPGASLEDLLRAARQEAGRALTDPEPHQLIEDKEGLRRGVDGLDRMIDLAASRRDALDATRSTIGEPDETSPGGYGPAMACAIPHGVPVSKALREQRVWFREMLTMYELSPHLERIGGGMTPEQIQHEIDALDRYLVTPEMVPEAKALGLIKDPEQDPQ